MHWFSNMPIRRKLMLVLLLTCTSMLLLVGVVLIATELVTFRNKMVSDLAILAEILGQNSTAALRFNDDNSAQQTLESLRAEPHITAASLYIADGNRLAEYVRPDAERDIPDHAAKDGYEFGQDSLKLFQAVYHNHKRIGTIYLRADLGRLYERLHLYGMIVGAVMLGAIALTVVVASRLRRPISEPILALAKTARLVTEKKDYAVRVPRAGQDEIGLLTDAFNQMLGDIETGQKSLRQYQEHLEAMVQQRTSQLAAANQDLVVAADAERQARIQAQKAHDAMIQAQARMMQSDKLASLGQLVAGVAHEINNPLAFVTNDVAVLQRDIPPLRELLQLYTTHLKLLEQSAPATAARIHEISDRIDVPYTLQSIQELLIRSRDGLHRIQQIVKDLRDFARQESIGDLSEAVDVNSGIHSTVNIVRGRARKQNVEIELDLGQLPLITCSPARINQVVLNLVVNAIDACESGGKITVRTRRGSGGGVEIQVIDTGSGIPPEIRGKIFDPFFTTKPQGQGTGLGLSISHGIVTDHGGEIDVESQPGHGTCFTVRLPPVPPGTASAPSPRPALLGPQ